MFWLQLMPNVTAMERKEAFKQVWHFRSKLRNNCKLIMMLTFCPAFAFCSQGRGFLLLQKPHWFEPNSCSGAVAVGERPQNQERALGTESWHPSAPNSVWSLKGEQSEAAVIKQPLRSIWGLSWHSGLCSALEVPGVVLVAAAEKGSDTTVAPWGFYFSLEGRAPCQFLKLGLWPASDGNLREVISV